MDVRKYHKLTLNIPLDIKQCGLEVPRSHSPEIRSSFAPSLLEVVRNSSRKNSYHSKLSNNPSPKNSARREACLALFPTESGRVGVFTPELVIEEQPPSRRLSIHATKKRKGSIRINSKRSTVKGGGDDLEEEIDMFMKRRRSRPLITIELSHIDALLKKLQSGRISIENISELDLIDLTINSLKRHVDKRINVEITILNKCLGNIEAYKQLDPRTGAQCIKAMAYISLKAGETIFHYHEITHNFWVLLKGSVDIYSLVNTDYEGGSTTRRMGQRALKKIRTVSGFLPLGELTTDPDHLRGFTAVCSADCHFALLGHAAYREILKEKMRRKLYDEVNFLMGLPLLRGWCFDSTLELFEEPLVHTYKRGMVIYNEEEEPKKMYIVKMGQFKVLKEVEMKKEIDEFEAEVWKLKRDAKSKEVIELGILCEKEVFGEEELLSLEKRKYKVVCESQEAEVFEISKKSLLDNILWHQSSKEWLEAYAKSKGTYYQNRISTVQTTHKKYKKPILTSKLSSNTPIKTSGADFSTTVINRPKTGNHTHSSTLSTRGEQLAASQIASPEFTVPNIVTRTLQDNNSYVVDSANLRSADFSVTMSRRATTAKAKTLRQINIIASGISSTIPLSPQSTMTPDTRKPKKMISILRSSSTSYPSKMGLSSTALFEQASPKTPNIPNFETWKLKKVAMEQISSFEEKIVPLPKPNDPKSPYAGNGQSARQERRIRKLLRQPTRDDVKVTLKLKRMNTETSTKSPNAKPQRSDTLFTTESDVKLDTAGSCEPSPTKTIKFKLTETSPDIKKRHASMTNEEMKEIQKAVEPAPLSERGFKKIHWQVQKQKVLNLIEEKAGKEYKRSFYAKDSNVRVVSKNSIDDRIGVSSTRVMSPRPGSRSQRINTVRVAEKGGYPKGFQLGVQRIL